MANKHNNISVSLLLLHIENKECSGYIFCKKFTFDINLLNYLFIWIVQHWHWSVPSIFKNLEKMWIYLLYSDFKNLKKLQKTIKLNVVKCNCWIQMSQMTKRAEEEKTKIILVNMIFNASTCAVELWHLTLQDTE